MRLLALDQFSDLGGAQRVLLDLLPEFRDRGWKTTVGAPGEGELARRAAAAGCDTFQIRCGPYRNGTKSAADAARFLFETRGLARQISDAAAGADVVYVNGPRLLPAAALSGIAIPVIFHAHSVVGGPAGMVARRALRRLRAPVIANCESVAKTWRGWATRLRVIYTGVPRSREAGLRSGRTVSCIGRIAPEKGQLDFVEAAGLIHSRMPECRFVVAGAPLFSDGGYEREVRRRAAGLPIEFSGWIDDVDDALARTDVLLVPSSPVEATTRVILEAYAAGAVVVAYANGGIPEVVAHGKTGFLARTPEEMARFTEALLRDPGLRASIATSAYEEWRDRFTLERYRRDVAAELERAWQPAAPRRPLRPMWNRSRSA